MKNFYGNKKIKILHQNFFLKSSEKVCSKNDVKFKKRNIKKVVSHNEKKTPP